MLEEVLHEVLVGVCPLDVLLLLRVKSKAFCQSRISLLVRLEAVCRVQVEGNLETFVLHVLHESFRIWEEGSVPCPSGPASATLVSIVPVHIYDQHVKRNVICVEHVHKRAELFV